MGFWQNVEQEREYRNISRKELAAAAHFSVNTISTGLKRNGMPEADLAMRISRVLRVPLEQLLDMDASAAPAADRQDIERRHQLFTRYLPVIEKLEQMPPDVAKAIVTIIKNQPV